MFSPGSAIWWAENLEDLFERYNLRPETSGAGFETKLQRQLDGAPDERVQLMAEVTFVSLLVVDDTTGATKRSSVESILSWMKQPATVPEVLDRALAHGIAATGLAFRTWRWVNRPGRPCRRSHRSTPSTFSPASRGMGGASTHPRRLRRSSRGHGRRVSR